MTDSHAHLADQISRGNEVSKTLKDQLKACAEVGVTSIMCILLENWEAELNKICVKVPESTPAVFFSAGLHPEIISRRSSDIKDLRSFVNKNYDRIKAIGECGIDYFEVLAPDRQTQIRLFEEQIKLANDFKLPLIIHTRPTTVSENDAYLDMIDILKNNLPRYGFVMHCFSGSPTEMKKFLKLGGYIGFAGNVTFPKATNVQESAKNCPLDCLLVETDAPFLAPQEFRGQINEPSYVVSTARFISKIKEVDYKIFEQSVDDNFKRFARI